MVLSESVGCVIICTVCLVFQVFAMDDPDITLLKSEGETAELSCEISDGENVQVKWTKNSQPLVEGKDVHLVFVNDATSKTLSIIDLRRNDSGVYTCQDINQKTMQTYNLHVRYTPIIVIHGPESMARGRDVNLKCTVHAFPQVDHLAWMKQKINETKGQEITTSGDFEIVTSRNESELTIRSLQKKHFGFYYCQGSNDVGFASSSKIDIIVEYPPEVTLVLETDKPVTGSFAKLSCRSSSHPDIDRLQWFFQKSRDDNTTRKSIVQGKHYFGAGLGMVSNMIIMPLRSTDEGYYYCIAHNKLGVKKSNVLFLDIVYGESTIMSIPASPVVTDENKKLEIVCVADGISKKDTAWYKGEKKISDGPKLVIEKTKASDNGEITCIANNTKGSRVLEVTITVKYPPRVNMDDVKLNLKYGRVVVLKCPVTGIPKPDRYIWTHNNVTIEGVDGQSHAVTFQKVDQKGYYTCRGFSSKGASRIFYFYLRNQAKEEKPKAESAIPYIILAAALTVIISSIAAVCCYRRGIASMDVIDEEQSFEKAEKIAKRLTEKMDHEEHNLSHDKLSQDNDSHVSASESEINPVIFSSNVSHTKDRKNEKENDDDEQFDKDQETDDDREIIEEEKDNDRKGNKVDEEKQADEDGKEYERQKYEGKKATEERKREKENETDERQKEGRKDKKVRKGDKERKTNEDEWENEKQKYRGRKEMKEKTGDNEKQPDQTERTYEEQTVDVDKMEVERKNADAEKKRKQEKQEEKRKKQKETGDNENINQVGREQNKTDRKKRYKRITAEILPSPDYADESIPISVSLQKKVSNLNQQRDGETYEADLMTEAAVSTVTLETLQSYKPALDNFRTERLKQKGSMLSTVSEHKTSKMRDLQRALRENVSASCKEDNSVSVSDIEADSNTSIEQNNLPAVASFHEHDDEPGDNKDPVDDTRDQTSAEETSTIKNDKSPEQTSAAKNPIDKLADDPIDSPVDNVTDNPANPDKKQRRHSYSI